MEMAKEEMLQMTQKDLDRVKVLNLAIQKRITQAKAGELLGLSREWVNRLCQKIKAKGDQVVIHGLRGRPSNNQLPEALIKKAKKKLEDKYADFGPTLAAEKLLESDGIKLSDETVRHLMIDLELWEAGKRKPVHREWRERKDCVGEMSQMDGSDHDWFEGRRSKCILLATIDDASNRIFLRFAEHEDTRNLMQFSWIYIKKFGKPRAWYVDKDSLYITNRQPSLAEELQGRRYALTQFTRAMEVDLDVKVLNAGSPQAKGRVERLFRTLQDRLIKELRLAGISSIPEANKFLDEIYLPKHNTKFSVPPKSKTDLHRSVGKTKTELDAIFSFQEERVIRNDYTFSWRTRLFQVEKHQPYYLRPSTRVTIEERLNDVVKARYKGKYLKMHEICKEEIRRPLSVPVQKAQQPRSPIPTQNHPWRKSMNYWARRAIVKREMAYA
ncbi:MAG: ISNCY family transposase [Candidatus Saganbacteria bacterium]|nr:ISNCY family transposase [Candidatus Saganbacteria bacterium]